MRKCRGKLSIFKNGQLENEQFELGFFHEWGTNYREFEAGAGNYSVAIVELPDGRIITPLPGDIQFLEPIK